MIKYIVSLSIIFIYTNSYSQFLSKQAVADDLNQLKRAIIDYNPALHAYNTNFNKEVDQVISAITYDSVDMITFFQFVSKACALSNEGHFALGNWEDEVHSGFLNNEYKYLPLTVRIIDGRMLVWHDISNEQRLKRGDEIISINDMSSDEILNLFYSQIPADGSITTYIDRNLELGFNWRYYLYIDQTSSFSIKTNNSNYKTNVVNITALTRDDQFKNFAKYYPPNDEKETESFYTLEIDKNFATLKIPSFDWKKIEEFDIKSKRFYQDIFNQLKSQNINHLIIDLRGNTGGRYEMADDIVPFIMQTNHHIGYLKKSTSWEGKTKTYKLPKPSKSVFSGQIYLLIDGRTYSSGSTVSRYLREFGNAIVIGEESGSRYEGFSAGSKQYVTLTHSQIEIGIPRYHTYFPPSKIQTTSNRGLIPDYLITFSFNDLLRKNDLHMKKAIELINNTK